MTVSYNGNAIIPGPLANIRKEYQFDEDGKQVGTNFVITLEGKMVAYKGSPNSQKVFWTSSGYPPDEVLVMSDQTFPAILRKQEALRELFSNEGQTLQIQPYDGSAPVTCNPRVRSIEFPKGGWYDVADYTIVLEADTIYIVGDNVSEDQVDDIHNYKVSKASEDWTLEPTDERLITFRLTHNVSATGKRFYNNSGSLVAEAWQNAQTYVQNKIGLGNGNYNLSASILDLSSDTQYYNHMVTERIGDRAGTYSVTETWILYDPGDGPPGVEELSISTRVGEDNKVSVSIEGTITGLLTNSASKYTNALAKYESIVASIFSRAQSFSGYTLNSNILTQTLTENNLTGIITYNYTYDNRPTTQVSGAKTELITVNYINPTDVFANIPVIGRPAGPILQPIGSTTASFINLNIEAQLPAFNNSQPNTDTIVATYQPSTGIWFKTRDEASFAVNSGRYTRQVSWIQSG